MQQTMSDIYDHVDKPSSNATCCLFQSVCWRDGRGGEKGGQGVQGGQGGGGGRVPQHHSHRLPPPHCTISWDHTVEGHPPCRQVKAIPKDPSVFCQVRSSVLEPGQLRSWEAVASDRCLFSSHSSGLCRAPLHQVSSSVFCFLDQQCQLWYNVNSVNNDRHWPLDFLILWAFETLFETLRPYLRPSDLEILTL